VLAIIGLDVKLETALIAAVVSVITTFVAIPIKFWADRKLQDRKLTSDAVQQERELMSREALEVKKLDLAHQHEQRQELQALKSKFRGRLVEAADLFHVRMLNLYRNVDEGWLNMHNDYGAYSYYFHSSVLRFLSLLSLAMRFEREAVFIEADYAREHEVQFLWFCKGMRWASTDVHHLFRGVDEYDMNMAADHFFTDQLRDICALIANGDEPEMGLTELVGVAAAPELVPAMQFFDGLRPDEDRHRWDRLIALHLIVMAFLNNFGYGPQGSDEARLAKTVAHFNHARLPGNLSAMLGELGLTDRAGPLVAALAGADQRSRISSSSDSPTPAPRA
jgi:hypothetical protein